MTPSERTRDPVLVVGSGLPAAAVARAVAAAGLRVTLVDEREPVRPGGGEGLWYAPWWPGGEAPIVHLTDAGISRLEAIHQESGEAFRVNRRGRLIVTGRPDTARLLRSLAGRQAALGHGPLREHASADWYLPPPSDGFRGVPDGFDLLEGAGLRAAFPFLDPGMTFGVHVRRAGWVDARALRRWLMGALREAGGQVVSEPVRGIEPTPDGWQVTTASGARLSGPTLVLAGARVRTLGRQAGFDLPWTDYTRLVGVLAGGERAVPGPCPMIVADLDNWGASGAAGELGPDAAWGMPSLLSDGDGALRLEAIVPGVPAADDLGRLGEALLQRLGRAVSTLRSYRGPPGGLVTTAYPLPLAPDLRPVIGMADRRGGFVVGGVGMTVGLALGAGDLLAAYLAGTPLPRYAPAFVPGRFGGNILRPSGDTTSRVDF